MSRQPLRGDRSSNIVSYAETLQTILDISNDEEQLRESIKTIIRIMRKDADTPLKFKRIRKDKDGKIIMPKIN